MMMFKSRLESNLSGPLPATLLKHLVEEHLEGAAAIIPFNSLPGRIADMERVLQMNLPELQRVCPSLQLHDIVSFLNKHVSSI
jgi:hypothetical protein